MDQTVRYDANRCSASDGHRKLAGGMQFNTQERDDVWFDNCVCKQNNCTDST